MSKLSTLVGSVVVIALAATAHAQDAVPPAAVASQTRAHVAVSLLPMGLGTFTASPGGVTVNADAAFAFGFGVSVGYLVIPRLTVGFAPQAFRNVKPKEDGGAGATQYDLMARVAYALPVADTIALYAEALPGYSLIAPPSGDTPRGFVLALGVGGAMDLTDRTFVNLGVGYQIGFQKRFAEGMETDVKTRYLRVALSVGRRF
jgi:hypothetical protein